MYGTTSFPGDSDCKESACSLEDLGLIPGLGRSPGGGHGNPPPVFLSRESPWIEEPGGLQSTELRRIGHNWATKHSTADGTNDWFRIEKRVWQGYLLLPCLFNLYAEHIMRNSGLDELQAGIKIGGKNINFRYVDDTTLMAENEEELKKFLMRVKEESEKAGLKPNIKKN